MYFHLHTEVEGKQDFVLDHGKLQKHYEVFYEFVLNLALIYTDGRFAPGRKAGVALQNADLEHLWIQFPTTYYLDVVQ